MFWRPTWHSKISLNRQVVLPSNAFSGKGAQRCSMKSVLPLVLVVEDDYDILRVTRAVLSASRYRVIAADTGQKALAEVAAQHPDIILLDLGLPDMSGVDVIRRLSSSQR